MAFHTDKETTISDAVSRFLKLWKFNLSYKPVASLAESKVSAFTRNYISLLYNVYMPRKRQ